MAQLSVVTSSNSISSGASTPACRRSYRALAGGLSLALFLGLTACAGAGAGTSDRYPEERRPETARSASDGEVLGAEQQDPSDTLDASLTNEHLGARSPEAEVPANEAAHERLDEEECFEASKVTPPAAGADAPGAETPGAGAPRRKPVCPPRP